MEIPERLPEKGFYYHYKHDPAGPLYAYAYEVTGVGRHTEDESYLAMYRPLYKSEYLGEADCFLRPAAMCTEDVTKDGKTFPRFQKVTDPEVIKKLEEIRDRMYS